MADIDHFLAHEDIDKELKPLLGDLASHTLSHLALSRNSQGQDAQETAGHGGHGSRQNGGWGTWWWGVHHVASPDQWFQVKIFGFGMEVTVNKPKATLGYVDDLTYGFCELPVGQTYPAAFLPTSALAPTSSPGRPAEHGPSVSGGELVLGSGDAEREGS